MFFAQPFAVGPGERVVAPVHMLGIDFSKPKSFLVLVTVVFGLCGIGVVALRRSAFGRRLVALRDSEAASVTVGVNILETKILVFSLSAGISGFAGAFIAMSTGKLTGATGFEALSGLPIVLALVIGGVGFVAGALFAGIFGLVLVIVQSDWHISLWIGLTYLAPGLAVLGIIQSPSGAVVAIGEGFARLLPWRHDARQGIRGDGRRGGRARGGRARAATPVRRSRRAAHRPRARHQRRRSARRDDRQRRDSHDRCKERMTMGLLEVEGVSVQFGGLLAVDDASFSVPAGCVTGLIGPNGAGKTTLFNVITGLQAPSRGRVLLGDDDVTRRRPYRRARLGIARTFQRLEAFGSLTARENVLVALEMRRRWASSRYDCEAVADELLARVGITSVADTRVEALPTGSARLVELARALATEPKVLLLDEPSSGLDDQETDALGVLLHHLTSDGLGVLLVEHDMPLVMEACTHISVLDFGRIIAEGTPTEIQANPSVQRAYLGTAKTAS